MSNNIIDMHFHVGLLGDKYPKLGKMTPEYRKKLVFKIFLLYAGIKENEVSDEILEKKTEEIIKKSKIDYVVCLALDPVFDENGNRCESKSYIWIDNEYILKLKERIGKKVLLGASVHPYDPKFEERIKKYVDLGAVLLKWLPSAQQINLADDRVKHALKLLATVKNGKPLPLLLHTGPEYAIPSTNLKTSSYDFLSWSGFENFINFLRGKKKWYKPKIKKIHENLESGLSSGAIIIFAHCGLPYYVPKFLGRILEHSDFDIVKKFLNKYQPSSSLPGKCYADVSACVTPFRSGYHSELKKIPDGSLLFGSDFPTPVFELSADLKENWKDFKAILDGDVKRLIVPQDNILDVNYRELSIKFPDHKMFSNFSLLINQ